MEGTFDARRHSDRVDHLYEDVPKPIRGLGTDGLWMWKQLQENTPAGILRGIDSAGMFAVCRSWAKWREADRADDDAGFRRHLEQWLKLGQQFGLTPISRCKLQAEGAAKKDTNDDLRKEFLA